MLLKVIVDGFSFGHEVMPSTSLNSLYIRECYRTIAARITNRKGIQKAIVTGTPGIGKSLFLVYLLWKLVREGERVLLIYGIFNIYYDGNGGVFQFDSGQLPSDIDYSFWNVTLWCLFDAILKYEANLQIQQHTQTFEIKPYEKNIISIPTVTIAG